MEKKHIFEYDVYECADELPQEIQELLVQAQESKDKAYAPYSNFHVGCALLLDNGTIITGNNQENAAYPSGLCAERVAIFHAHATFPENKIMQLAITTSAENPLDAVSPCGSCRQVLVEFEKNQKQDFAIYFQGKGTQIIKIHRASDLLPFCFNSDMLTQ